MLVVEQTNGERNHFYLTAADGSPLGLDILGYVAEPIRIRGHEQRLGDLLFFAADVDSIERVR